MSKMYFRCPVCNQRLFASTEGNWFPINIKMRCVKCKKTFVFVVKMVEDPAELVADVKDMSNEDLANLLTPYNEKE
jgi:transcription elongation factor Elf1